MIFGDIKILQYCFNWAYSICSYMLKGYEICLNITKTPIFNIQDSIYRLYTYILDCCDQLVSPLCMGCEELMIVSIAKGSYCLILPLNK